MTLEEEEAVQQELWELENLAVCVPQVLFTLAVPDYTIKEPKRMELPTVPAEEISVKGNGFYHS